MPLKELEQLKAELEALRDALRYEGRAETRRWIFGRVSEIMSQIVRPTKGQGRLQPSREVPRWLMIMR